MPQSSLRGGVAGAVATAVMTLEQPPDKRLFDSKYDDVEILGELVTRGDDWQPIGFALHVQNGAFLGARYARLKPSLPGDLSSPSRHASVKLALAIVGHQHGCARCWSDKIRYARLAPYQ